jgi:hypothetical protein
MLPKLQWFSVAFGADPEFFFQDKTGIIGAEKVIPKEGLIKPDRGKIIIDGVQAELNPLASTCREVLRTNISHCFSTLNLELSKKKDVNINFSRTVEIPEDNLMQLDASSRKFGCAPSINAHGNKNTLKMDTIDPIKYRIRAAGGHIHLGHANNSHYKNAFKTRPEVFAMFLDLVVSIPSVLMDRDPSNIERRKLYGRAGEYRLPAHGFEYRTPSNFWLTSYPLMSLVFGLARMAVQMAGSPHYQLYLREFFSEYSSKEVEHAINSNDFNLAYKIYNSIEKKLISIIPEGRDRMMDDSYPIRSSTIKHFHHFVNRINENGLEYWFKDSPLDAWLKSVYLTYGFSAFAREYISADMKPKTVKSTAA